MDLRWRSRAADLEEKSKNESRREKLVFPIHFIDLLLSLLHRNVCNSVYIRSRAAQNRKKPKTQTQTQDSTPKPKPKPKILMSCKILTFIHYTRQKTLRIT